jgi:replicative DNA helicase
MIKNIHVERSLLASVIYADEETATGNAYQLIGEVDEKLFYYPEHRAIYRAIKECIGKEWAPDVVHIHNFLDERYQYKFYELGSIATTTKLDNLIGELRTYAVARNLSAATHNVSVELERATDVRETLSDVEGKIMSAMVSAQKKFSDEGYICDYIGEYYRKTEELMKSRELQGVPSGISEIDNILGGFRGGDAVVVGGRSGMGKSSFVATMMCHQIIKGYKPAVFSFELGRKEIVDKVYSIMTELDPDGHTVSFKKLYNPAGNFSGVRLTIDDLQRTCEISNKYLQNSKAYIRGASKTTVEEVMSKCRKLKGEGNLDIIIIDHIGLLVQDKKNSVAELAHITGSLKLFAAEMGVPIIEVVQLNRDADTVREKPRLSHLKGSGSIEEDANIVIMPWRPYAINKELDPHESEIIIAKSRNSGDGTIPTYFSTETTSFTVIDRSHKELDHQGKF